MPLLQRRRVLAAKIETTVGTAISVSGTDATFNVFDAQIVPDITNETRQSQGTMSQLPAVPGMRSGTCTFSLELTGGASVPAWASTFLPACGMPLSSTTATVSSEPAGSNTKTLTLALYEDGNVKAISGAMGSFVLRCITGQRVMLDFTFRGKWHASPSATSILTPTYGTTAPLTFRSSTITIGSFAPKLSEFTIDLGNEIVLREDPSDATGILNACIVGRMPTGTMNPESTLVNTHSSTVNIPYADWVGMTERALSLTLGSSGNQCVITAPKLQVTKVEAIDRNGIIAENISFQLNKSSSGGNDELVFEFANP